MNEVTKLAIDFVSNHWKEIDLKSVELEEFTLKNKRKYGVDDENGFITTSTLFTEALITDLKKTNYDN